LPSGVVVEVAVVVLWLLDEVEVELLAGFEQAARRARRVSATTRRMESNPVPTPPSGQSRRGMSMSLALIQGLLAAQLGAKAEALAPLAGGQVGRVWRADVAGRPYVVKLVRVGREPSFAEEPRDNRVYGSRWSNLLPAYRALRDAGVATPTLHASGVFDSEGYAILDYLDGVPGEHSGDWYACLGESLGRVHGVRRGYQGWVGMETPLAEGWAAAFGLSLQSRLADVRPFLAASQAELAVRRIGDWGPLDEPEDFVLSHTDGFQGVFARGADGWTLAGVIDIEDHQFTDRRFVLAGLELGHAIEGRALPEAFWRAYRRVTGVGAEAMAHKRLFQLYYLLVWIRVLQGQGALGPCVARLAALLG
jgi:fructosamine-3-kinase